MTYSRNTQLYNVHTYISYHHVLNVGTAQYEQVMGQLQNKSSGVDDDVCIMHCSEYEYLQY